MITATPSALGIKTKRAFFEWAKANTGMTWGNILGYRTRGKCPDGIAGLTRISALAGNVCIVVPNEHADFVIAAVTPYLKRWRVHAARRITHGNNMATRPKNWLHYAPERCQNPTRSQIDEIGLDVYIEVGQ